MSIEITTATSKQKGGIRTALDIGFGVGGPLRVACVGTSITNQSSILATDANPRLHDLTNGHAGWLEHLTNHKVRLVRRNGVYESLTDKTFGYPGFGLNGLTNGSGGVYPLDNAIGSGAEVLILEGGTNDVSGGDSSSTVISKITAYWTKAVNAGCRVIALNIPPMGSGIINATKRDVITSVNAALPALATSLGVTLIDVYATATIDANGYATTESAFDGIHPTPAYAHRMAELIAIPLNTWSSNRPQEMIVPNQASALWLTQSNSPSQATIPTGWSKSGTFTDTYSAVTDADGTTWQRVRMVQTGTANSIMRLFILNTTGLVAGDRVRYACRIRPVSGGTSDFTETEFFGSTFDTASRQYRGISGGANLGTGNYNAVTGLFVSPIFTLQPSVGQIQAVLSFYGNDVQFDVRQFGVFKVIENP